MRPQRIEDAERLSRGRRTVSWLIDEVITVTLIVIGIVPVFALDDSMPSVSSSTWALVALSVALVLPALYGLLCFNGRSIGCLVAGTAFFSVATGYRAHNARMMWVMGHRWLWPLIAILFVFSLFSGDVTPSPDRLHRQLRVRGVEPVRTWAPLPGQGQHAGLSQPYPPQQYAQQPVQQRPPSAYPPTQQPMYPPQQQMYPPAQPQPGQPPFSPANPPQPNGENLYGQ